MVLLRKACQECNVNLDDLQDFIKKKYIIEKVFTKKYPIRGSISNYAIVYDLPDIISNLSRQIYFTYFQKICRQIARVLETFVKLIEDKQKILFGLKRVTETKLEEWIHIKVEELIIQRIMNRQSELSIIFHAQNKPFYVNSFILARFLDTTLLEAAEILREESSPIYQDIIDLGLPRDMISPVSYLISYDLLHRIKNHQEMQAMKIDIIKEDRIQEEQERIEERMISNQANTLNWIDKKITSTLISVQAVSVNPTSLYWSDKDQKIVVENIIQHSRLPNRTICNICGTNTTDQACPDHSEEYIEATPRDLYAQFFKFAYKTIQKNFQEIKVPAYARLQQKVADMIDEAVQNRLQKSLTREESNQLIEGEERFVAEIIAKTIGKSLDKAIYKKFKVNLRKKKS
jgi:hypothetical protein